MFEKDKSKYIIIFIAVIVFIGVIITINVSMQLKENLELSTITKQISDKRIATNKVISGKKAIADKVISDAKTVQDQEIADAKIASDKVIAEAILVADKKAADAKATADSNAAAQVIAQAKRVADAKIVSDRNAASEKTFTDSNVNEIVYTGYYNRQYGFSIQYPNFLTEKQSIDDMENYTKGGYIFSSPDQLVTFKVEGFNNIENLTTLEYFESLPESMSVCQADIIYQKFYYNAFIYKYRIHGDVIYEFAIVGNGSINTFQIEYPITEENKYIPVEGVLYTSFKAPGIDMQH